jgi:hypothetical protein
VYGLNGYSTKRTELWESVWVLLSRLEGLQELYFVYPVNSLQRHLSQQQQLVLLAPLMAVSRPLVFEVHLPWPGEQVKDAPFRIVRPGEAGHRGMRNNETA